MAQEEIGVVVQHGGEMAKVQLSRKDACTGCKGCLLGNNGFMYTVAKDTVGASVGDRVRLGITSPGQAKSGFILYILPLLFFFPGYPLGAYIGGQISDVMRDAFGFLGGILFMAMAYLGIFLISKTLDKKKPRIRIIETLPRSDH